MNTNNLCRTGCVLWKGSPFHKFSHKYNNWNVKFRNLIQIRKYIRASERSFPNALWKSECLKQSTQGLPLMVDSPLTKLRNWPVSLKMLVNVIGIMKCKWSQVYSKSVFTVSLMALQSALIAFNNESNESLFFLPNIWTGKKLNSELLFVLASDKRV